MVEVRNIEHDDIQALARFSHGQLKDSQFFLLTIIDPHAAGLWLQKTTFTSAAVQQPLPDTAIQIAFTLPGLEKLGLSYATLKQFPDDFRQGMSDDENRSRRLGDIGKNAPANWCWGHHDENELHVLLMLYAREGAIEPYSETVMSEQFLNAFGVYKTLPTDTLKPREPFGFVDGTSQPSIDWDQSQRTDVHSRSAYSNLLAPGEVVLGYGNEYGRITRRPIIDPQLDPLSTILPEAHDSPKQRDFGGNGSFLILRQLQQEVGDFWQFMQDQTNGDSDKAEELAALMVGRDRSGAPLVPPAARDIPGIPKTRNNNHFDFDHDASGTHCPVSAHIRRSNPRTGDFPPGATGLLSRLVRMLGFKRKTAYEDLVASSRFHRILRRGRTYGGPILEPAAAIAEAQNGSGDNETPARGLQFICLAGNILRQFEFIQSAWCISSGFAGTREQQDPLLGHREPRVDNGHTNSFMHADERGAQYKTSDLRQFVTVRGGAYFFMPGLRAIRYLGQLAAERDHSS